MEDRNFFTTRGDSRIEIMIGKNEFTSKLNRDSRFIIDDAYSERKLAYALTKPLKVGRSYGDDGVFCFILQEVQSTDNDNLELEIADYYKHFPREDSGLSVTTDIEPDTNFTSDGRKVYL